MAIAAKDIYGSITGFALRSLMVGVNAGTASLTDISAAQVSLDEKAALRDVKNAVATRAGINARELDLPTKAVLFAMAGV